MSTTASAQAPAATAAIDPHSVLEQLDPLLGQTGCIRSSKEVGKIVSLMKTAQLLVVRIVLLNIIKATRAPSTLDRFMDGGWPVLNAWLAEAKKKQDFAVLVGVLQVLQKLPVSVAALKQGNMGKLIKQLSKQEHPEVKDLACDLLSKWMAIFKEGQAATKSRPAGSASDTPEKEKEEKTAASSTAATKSQDSAPSTPTKNDKDKKDKPSKKKDKSSKGAVNLPPVESKPPPGPLVALGRRDKPLKRPRDFPLKGQPPVEKKNKLLSNSEEKMKGKGPVESEGFMNALSSQAAKMKEKKRKISKPKALSLVSKTGSGGVVAGEADSPTPTSAEPQEPMDTGTPTSDQKGEEGSKRKKKVSWAEDSNLVMVHYFEMDESERAINREQGSFLDAAQREKTREREARESGLMFIRDRLIEMISWQRPQRNESVVELVNYGINSEQRKIQAEREEKVLAQLFLSKSSLHPSPAEPDAEPDTGKSEPKHIPLMEPTVDGQQQSSPTFSSPPHQVGGAPPPPHMTTAAAGSPLQSPAATIHQAQSLINSFNDGKGHMPPDSRPHPPGPPDQNSFHPPPGPHPPPNFHGNGPGMMPPSVGTGDFYNNYNQQGFPPGVHNPDWNGPMTGGYYGDYGGGAPPIRRGMRGGYRGRGRGFSHGYGKGPHAEAFSKICKHFVTHGCRLGTKCRFLHCTPSQLAEKLSTQQDPAQPQSSSPQDTSSITNANSSNNKPDIMATDSAADDNRS